MPIINVETMKTIDEREIQNTTKEKQTKTERSKGNRCYSEKVRAKWFCCGFKLGFFQLLCKASLIFKSNLELFRVSNYLKTKRIIWVKARCCVVYIFKNMRLAILLDMLLNPSFKMRTSFANIGRTTASTSKFTYQERFRIIRYWVFIWKLIFQFGWIKT